MEINPEILSTFMETANIGMGIRVESALLRGKFETIVEEYRVS